MKKDEDKDLSNYIEELEDKIIDLSLKLKAKNNQLQAVQSENYMRTRKVVHNLKNPIGVAYSFAEILANVESINANEKHKKYIEIIKNSNDYSIQILNSLGSLNRLKSPDFKLECASVSYQKLVSEVASEYASETEIKHIQVEEKFPENELFLNVDSQEIEFVIQVLINNALRYSPNHTTITVEVIENDDAIETTITDEGIGVSETDLKTVFNEFSVVNTYDTSGKKCIGLGLAIAKIILQHHKGYMAISSTLNCGTAVKFSIPKK